MELTEQQKEAVSNRGGRLLVSAAAGSGKTKVLVDRLLAYLTDPVAPANIEEFLIITYTKAAATELRGKIAAKLSERIAQEPENQHLHKQLQRLFLTKISTIHGFCAEILREYAYAQDIPGDFRVADENECQEIRENVLRDLLDRAYQGIKQGSDFQELLDSQSLGRDDRTLPEIIQQVYDSSRCHKNPEQWLSDCLTNVAQELPREAAQTRYGEYLIQELHEYLDGQVELMGCCAKALDAQTGMEKPAANIWDTVYQMQKLRKQSTWDAIRTHGQIRFDRLTFPKKNTNPELTERVKAIRNACKTGLAERMEVFTDSNEKVLKDLGECAGSTRALIALVREFDRDYTAAKRSRRVLDFSDLEQRTLDLLLGKLRLSPTATAAEIGRRYREVLVDEYQDSNGVQDAIFMALTQERQNCFLVGDVKQSIYQFRLADPGIFLEKYRAYADSAVALERQGRKILLSDNFRSGPEVIQAVNDVFCTCMSEKVGNLCYSEAEQLREGMPHSALTEPGVELYALKTDGDSSCAEAEFVAEKIDSMLRNKCQVRDKEGFRNVKPEDIVILLRSPGSVGYEYQRALECRGIRCATGAGQDLLKTEEVETLWAFLKIIQNPRQDIPLLTTLASPIFGFTADELALLRGREKREAIFEVIRRKDTPRVQHFLRILEQLRRDARMCSITTLLEQCFTRTRLDSIYASMPNGDARIANLRAFFQLAVDYEQGALRDLSQFLNHLEGLEQRGIPAPAAASQGCVTIMSIHKSKGLEYPVVFLCNLSRGFNKTDLKKQILCDRELGIGLSVADRTNRLHYPSIAKYAIAKRQDAQSISEELRILYVAMTRARDRLIMTYALRYLENRLTDYSMRLCMGGRELLCADVSSLGDWVMITALGRIEAGALHHLAGRPEILTSGDYPWKIEVVTPNEPSAQEQTVSEKNVTVPENLEERLGAAVSFCYQYEAATRAPSKQTATDRKGRLKDAEAAEDAYQQKKEKFQWREPNFHRKQPAGKDYGKALHAALQYIRYEKCDSIQGVEAEIDGLVEKGFLSKEQGDIVNRNKIARFFATQLGEKLRGGTPHLREFKFSILDHGIHYGAGLEGEEILLQGVVDCALLEEDGITVVDFKTDYVTEDTLATVTERYRNQIETYAIALERIYESRVKEKLLYFFHLDRFVKL